MDIDVHDVPSNWERDFANVLILKGNTQHRGRFLKVTRGITISIVRSSVNQLRATTTTATATATATTATATTATATTTKSFPGSSLTEQKCDFFSFQTVLHAKDPFWRFETKIVRLKIMNLLQNRDKSNSKDIFVKENMRKVLLIPPAASTRPCFCFVFNFFRC